MTALETTCEALAERYGELGADAAKRLGQWLSGEIPLAHPDLLKAHLGTDHLELLFDAFWQILPFGTGGRRGRVGYGSNRLNHTTVAMTVQGHCDYLRRLLPDRELSVVIANDVRVFRDLAGVYGFLGPEHPLLGVSSRSLGQLAASIYAANGIAAWMRSPRDDRATLSTPELSYLIVALEAQGGINLSASHNPPDDNGVKIYDGFGSQPIAPEDQQLIDVMAGATGVRQLPFEQALDEGFVREVPPERHRAYVDLYVDRFRELHTPDSTHSITFTPLCGCGLETAGELLETLGFPLHVPADQHPDGSFASIPFRAPNPEVFQATAPARRFADERGSEIVLSTDPDADRVGCEIKLEDGSWFHFDGNQIAAMLAWLLMLDPEGPQRRGLLIATAVTTKILRAIAERAGDSAVIDDLLVGFKYVADVLKRLGRGEAVNGVSVSPEQLVLAAEESHGVILLPGIRDKDAAPACGLLAGLHQRQRSRGLTLLDYYTRILEELGPFDNFNRSIVMGGAEGMLKKDRIMAALREKPPAEIGGNRVLRCLDFWDQDRFGPFVSASDRLPRNVIQFETEGCVVTVRPSGTEPKLKVYVQLLPGGEPPSERGPALLQAVRGRAESLARRVYGELLAQIDMSLGEAGLRLPDIVDLERKLEFEANTVPALRRALENGAHSDFDGLLAWLGEAVAPMTPGTDALPAVKAPIAWLCREWQAELGDRVDALARWAEE